MVQLLLDLGVSVNGQTTIQPGNYPDLGSNIRNPNGSWRVAGGGCTGGAAAVAAGEAQIAVGGEFLPSVRLPAACMGLFAYVPTPGLLGTLTEPAAAVAAPPGSLAAVTGVTGRTSPGDTTRVTLGAEVPGFVSSDLQVLCTLASSLGLPGAGNLKHELTQVVVAEDMFELCESEMSAGVVVMKKAVLAWAGQEQAGSVQLMPFLANNMETWRELVPEEGSGKEEEGTEMGSEWGEQKTSLGIWSVREEVKRGKACQTMLDLL